MINDYSIVPVYTVCSLRTVALYRYCTVHRVLLLYGSKYYIQYSIKYIFMIIL